MEGCFSVVCSNLMLLTVACIVRACGTALRTCWMPWDLFLSGTDAVCWPAYYAEAAGCGGQRQGLPENGDIEGAVCCRPCAGGCARAWRHCVNAEHLQGWHDWGVHGVCPTHLG